MDELFRMGFEYVRAGFFEAVMIIYAINLVEHYAAMLSHSNFMKQKERRMQ